MITGLPPTKVVPGHRHAPPLFVKSGRGCERGFALLIVLWSLVILSLILGHMLSAERSEVQLAGNLRQSAKAEAIADGAVFETLFRVTAGGAQAWAPVGAHVLRIGGGTVAVVTDDLSGKINPNIAGLRLLRAITGLCGASYGQATGLARAIMTWRGDPPDDDGDPIRAYRASALSYAPPGLPMETIEEMGLIIGMTPALLSCLSPHLSLLQDSQPDTHTSDGLVARAVSQAIRDGDAATGPPARSGVLQITATSELAGARFVRQITARLGSADDGRPFRILTWRAGAQ